jgi:putative flippase GtrA
MARAIEKERAGLPSKMTRFVGTGAVNTALTFVTYQLLLLVIPYWLAYTLSFAGGIVFAALVNARLVFEVRLRLGNGVRFAFFYVVSYLIGLALLSLLVAGVGIPAALAALIIIPIMLPINFFGSRIALEEA